MSYRTYSPANGFIVNKLGNGNFTTIQAAINAAVSGQTIFVSDGIYTEDLTLKAGIDLVAFLSDADQPNVTILGNTTFAVNGTVSISSIKLETNGTYLLTVSGTGLSTLNLNECFLNCTNFIGINFTSTNASSTLNIKYCTGNLTFGQAYFTQTSPGNLNFSFCNFLNTGNSILTNLSSAGTLTLRTVIIGNPITTIGSNLLQMSGCVIPDIGTNVTALTVGGAGSNIIGSGGFGSGSAIPIVVNSNLRILECQFSTANTVTITGNIGVTAVLSYGLLSSQNTTTIKIDDNFASKTALSYILGRQAEGITPIGNYLIQNEDAYVYVTTSAGISTMTLPPVPLTDEVHTIADISGQANLNNITVSGNGNNILGSSSAGTYVMSNAGQSNSFIWNGSLWKVYSAFGDSSAGSVKPNHSVLLGTGTPSIGSVGPSATAGVPLISKGASLDPAYGTALVAGGGTGQVTLTNHGVLVGAGTSAITQLAAGSAGQVLQSGGASADPVYSTATYPATASGTGTILRADGTNWSATTSTYPNTNAVSTLLYASSTNVISALATANSGVLATGATGVPSIDTTNFAVLSTGVQLKGNNANTTPPAGFIGEIISSVIAGASGVNLSNNSVVNVTSISLTAGIWDVTGIVMFTVSAITVPSLFAGSIVTTSATNGTSGDNSVLTTSAPATGGIDNGLSIAPYRILLSSTTTVYLTAYASAASITGKAFGRITAIRAG